MAIKLWKQPKIKKSINPASDALRLKRGEIKEIDVTDPKVLELARMTPYGDLETMAKKPIEPMAKKPRLQWYSATGEPDPRLETWKNRLVELRKKSRYSLSVLSPAELDEIDYIEEQLRKAGVTNIGGPSPLQKWSR